MTVTEPGPVLIELPREGYRLYFSEVGHKHQRVNDQGRPGSRLVSCSTISAATPDRPDGLMYWTETLAMQGVVRMGEAGLSIPSDPYVLRNVLEQHGLRWTQIRDEAATRGTNVHKRMLEALALGGEVPDLDSLSEEERGYGQAVMAWWLDREPVASEVEQQVLSLEHNVAGRFDLRGTLRGYDGTTLVDLKTGKSIRWKDHVQLAGYDLMARECGIGGSDQQLILQVDANGNYIEHEVVATADDFLTALASYRGKSAGEGRMRKMEKLRERGE